MFKILPFFYVLYILNHVGHSLFLLFLPILSFVKSILCLFALFLLLMLISHSFESAPAPCKAGETHRKIHTSANTHNLAPTSNCLAFSTAMVETKLLSGFKTTLSKSCRTAATSSLETTSEHLKKHLSRLTSCS